MDADTVQQLADAAHQWEQIKNSFAPVIGSAIKLLNLISFFAAGPKEVHAWHIAKGSPITKTAGKIHSDLERGFIRAEIFNYNDLIEHGTEAELRAKGKIRMEGKDYITRDGDVLHIHFKV